MRGIGATRSYYSANEANGIPWLLKRTWSHPRRLPGVNWAPVDNTNKARLRLYLSN